MLFLDEPSEQSDRKSPRREALALSLTCLPSNSWTYWGNPAAFSHQHASTASRTAQKNGNGTVNTRLTAGTLRTAHTHNNPFTLHKELHA